MDSTEPVKADKTAINRRRAERRREVARTIRDLRERLSTGSDTGRAFDYELTLIFALNRLSASFALPLLILATALTAMLWVEWPAAAGWAALTLAAHGLMLSLCYRFKETPASEVNLRPWTRRLILAELVYGACFASLLFVVGLGDGFGIEMFQFAMTLVTIAVGTMLASTLQPASVAATMPATLFLAVLFAKRSELVYVALAIMAIGVEAFFLILAARIHHATVSTLESRAEKDVLIAELGTAKAMSDEARRRAEEANLAKSRFLATMSHELRTPLNAILGFSEVIRNEVLGPIENKSYKEYVGDIHTSGQHLLNLINEILDLSRIEAGRYELKEEPVNLKHIVDECRNLIQLKARNKNIVIAEQSEPDMPRLWADERAVRQVVLNLLSNAVKFTQPGGEVTIKVGWTAGGGQYVSVKDNGPGIPEEEIPIVLSTFGQGSIAIKSAEQGAGLGLPIVQALMHTHDGTFELKSKLREGTEAIIAFPRTRVMEALPPISDRERIRRSQAG